MIVNRDVTVAMYLDNLLPAIEAKWPAWCPKKIRIQQDNAKPHPKPGADEKINLRLSEMATRGFDVAFVNQPPNSPDTNTFDLAFFRAIQSIQHEKPSRNIDDLIKNVQSAFEDLPLLACIKVWTTAQIVMNEIILSNGGINYKIPHVGKDKIIRKLGHHIPLTLPCTAIQSNATLSGEAIVAFGEAFGETY